MQTNSEFSNELDEESTGATANLKISTTQEEENEPDTAEEDSDPEEFQPRIVQVTNFQQLTNENPMASDKIVKQEMSFDAEQTNRDNRKKSEINSLENDEEQSSDLEEDVSDALKTCKPSLFTKRPKRQWPWLIENRTDDLEGEIEDRTNSSTSTE